METAIDQECSRILARRHRAASDLRLVLACTKVATDLQRMGDVAARIARFAIKMSEQGEAPKGNVETRHIGSRVRQTTHDVLNAFARFDARLALTVAKEDKSVDHEYRSATRELVTYMMEDPCSIARVLNIMSALRSLERIGDHARNIAEHVIYLIKGTDFVMSASGAFRRRRSTGAWMSRLVSVCIRQEPGILALIQACANPVYRRL